MQTPKYSLTRARNELDNVIRGWGFHNANERQIAQLRGIKKALDNVIDTDTRMAMLMEVDRGRPVSTST